MPVGAADVADGGGEGAGGASDSVGDGAPDGDGAVAQTGSTPDTSGCSRQRSAVRSATKRGQRSTRHVSTSLTAASAWALKGTPG